MLRYSISLLLLMLGLTLQAQLFQPLEVGRQPMIRFSVDPSISLKSYLQEANISGVEIAVDTEIKQNLFLVGGVGTIGLKQETSSYTYNSLGSFLLAGFNLNLTQYQSPKDRDIFYVGLHYGYGMMSHEAPRITMENHWGTNQLSVAQETRTASWVEIAGGVKAEIMKNVFVGWTGKVKTRTHLSKGKMSPYYIPGFGKTTSRSTLDFNLWVSYAISFRPKKAKPQETITE